MRICFTQTLRDILELNNSAREQRIKGWLIFLTGLAVFLLGLSVPFFGTNKNAAMPLLIAGAVFTLLGGFATRLAGLGAWFLATQRIPFDIEIMPKGLIFADADSPALVEWPTFSRWFETKNLFVLCAKEDSLAIPKRVMNTSEREQLFCLLQTALGKPASG